MATVDPPIEITHNFGPGAYDFANPDRLIPVAEIFGPTLQGEGALAGLPTYFVRVGGCDYACAWCDSGHAVNASEVRQLPRMSQASIAGQLITLEQDNPGPEWVTVSGGNPGLYDMSEFVKYWKDETHHYFKSDEAYLRYKVAVETQGTKWQSWFATVNLLTISPKPPSSGMSQDLNRIYEFIGGPVAGAEESNHLRNVYETVLPREQWRFVLKVVVFDEDDYQFARALHGRYPLIAFYLSCGTAMGGLSGKWVPPAIPDLNPGETDLFRQVRTSPDVKWTPGSYVDRLDSLLRRYRWLADRMKGDPLMADVRALPQLHALTWGITTRGT